MKFRYDRNQKILEQSKSDLHAEGSRVTEEVEAESVAYLSVTECGIPRPQSSAYIAKYIKGLKNSEDSFNQISIFFVKTAVNVSSKRIIVNNTEE